MTRRPPRTTLFPCTTLIRSEAEPLVGPEMAFGAPETDLYLVGHDHSACLPHLADRLVEKAGGQIREALVRHERRSEEHTSELQSRQYLVCRLLLDKKHANTS